MMMVYLFVLKKIELTEMIGFFFGLALLCVLAGYAMLRRSSDQIIELSKKTTEILKNKSDDVITMDAESEVQNIAENFNVLMQGLKNAQQDIREQSVQLMGYAENLSKSYKKIREEEELREKLSQYVGKNVVNRLIESMGGILFNNQKKEVTVLFADIRGFSTLAEKMEADELINMLNEYFSIMVDIIFRNNGVLDKFVGDQIMAVFGLIPSDEEMPHYNAINTASEMQSSTEILMKKRKQQGKETFTIGIGINTGDAVIGNVGSDNRKNFTVVGDSVNVAGRLQQLAKGGEIVIGGKTYSFTKDHFDYEEMGQIQVKNRTQPVTCYKLRR